MPIKEFIKSDDFRNEKHVPVIEINTNIKKSKSFIVEVTVGKEIAHPNTTEHFINWISLYFKPENSGNIINLGKAEFTAHGESVKGLNEGPAYTDPTACFKIKLNEPGILHAVSYCNIHGLWENELKVTF
jgi:superoxide reductase